ncbi:hypothetical protein PV350_30765 [Streptomyces sp. PA03-6a]|nr:hypothetical protein [Streptomyces sp. PA03-6a]
MSDNRGQDWLDDATAERLLRGAHGDDPAERAWRDERAAAVAGLLAAAAAPAPLDPEREEAAVAAFRAARGDDALTGGSAGVRLGTADDWSPGAGAVSRSGRSRTPRHSRSLTGTLIATAAVAGVSVAAAAGALPALLGSGVPDPAPVHTQSAATAASDSGSPSPGRTAPPTSRPGPGPGHGRPAGGTGGTHGTVLPGRPAGTLSSTPSSTPALDHRALCRAYAAAGRHRKGVDEQAYKQLREAAGGGQREVRRYCAGLLGWNGGHGGNGGKAGKGDERGDDDSREGRGRWKNRSGGHHRQGGHGSRGTARSAPVAPSVPASKAAPSPLSAPVVPSDGRPGPHRGHGGE